MLYAVCSMLYALRCMLYAVYCSLLNLHPLLSTLHPPLFTPQMSEDDSGLTFSLDTPPSPTRSPLTLETETETEGEGADAAPLSTSSPRPTHTEAAYNGRLLLFVDIEGVLVDNEEWECDGVFPFTLLTKEEELRLETGPEGVEWLRTLQKMCVFVKVQGPKEGEVVNIFDLTNAGEVFTLSPDVQLALHTLASKPDPAEETLDFVKLANELLRALPEVRCNREAMTLLGERVEDVVRALGEGLGTVGAEELSSYADLMGGVCERLGEVKTYIKPYRRAGWLALASEQPPAKGALDALDAALMVATNHLLGALLQEDNMIEKKEYAVAADVGQCVRTLGGLEAVHVDTIKGRSLAKLIGADGGEVVTELRRFNPSNPSTASSFTGFSSAVEDYSPPPRSCLGALCYYLCLCGCFGCVCQEEDYQLRKAKALSASVMRGYRKDSEGLQEPLVT
jgi:hypothetical protein